MAVMPKAEKAFSEEEIGQLAVMTFQESDVEELEVVVPAYGSKLDPDEWMPEQGNYQGPGGRKVNLMRTANGVVVRNIETA